MSDTGNLHDPGPDAPAQAGEDTPPVSPPGGAPVQGRPPTWSTAPPVPSSRRPGLRVDMAALSAAPWLAGAGAILAALVLYWIGALISALQHFPGLGVRGRVLRLLQPGDVEWALALLLGVGLLVLASREPRPGRRSPTLEVLLSASFVAACAVGVAAVVELVIEVSRFGNTIDAAATAVFQLLAAIVIAAAAALWALSTRPAALASLPVPGSPPRARPPGGGPPGGDATTPLQPAPPPPPPPPPLR